MNRIEPITVDESLWPLVVSRLVGTPSRLEFEQYLAKRAGFLQRGQHLLLVDGTSIGLNPAEQRQLLVAWTGQHRELMRERLLGTAYATTSDAMRLTLSILYHLRPPVSPYVILSRLDEAAGWAVSRLQEVGQYEAAERVRHRYGFTLEQRAG
jgi:hypothetical protein